ncbi:MAG: glycosyltransferase family 39 protein [Elusimicrobia bacterium]|nr:glycosyltransferase family 39 protein [Elusimicrobiota bacterium]
MADENDLPGWRKKFLANRMTFESILFERESVLPQKEKMSTGLLVLAGIWLFYSLLLAQWVLRRGYFFVQADAESFTGLLRYAAYLKSQGVLALIKPELAGMSLNPPFYFLAYVPVLSYLTSDLNLALIIVNSFFMLVLALSVFAAVRKTRPNRSGWLGAAFALSMPFVLETARRPAPEMALMALVAALYACYIRSEEFEQGNKWTFWFALCLSLGFFSHRFFWLYTLPLIPFILTGLSSPLSRDELLKGIFPGLLLNLPWYLFSAAVLASGFLPVIGAYQGFWACLKTGLASAGLPLFTLGALALAWMYFSVFMPYEKKKIVAALFWVPYLVLTWGLRGSRPELLYPAMLLPFAIAVPVMTPHALRRYLFVLVLALGAVNQSGLVPPFSLGRYSFGGLPLPPSQVYRVDEIISQIKAGTPAKAGLVGVYGGDNGLNADSLRFAALKAGLDARFENDPACPACASVLILKTRAAGAAAPRAGAFAGVKAQPWFPQLFAKKTELALADASWVEVYVKVPGLGRIFEDGTYSLGALTFGELSIPDATLKVEGFDAAAGAYAKGEFFAPSAALRGGDIYGLTLQLEGVQLAGAAPTPVPAGMKSLKLTSAKITSYALEKYLSERFPSLSELQVTLDRTLGVSAVARGRKLEAEFILALTAPDVIEIRPVVFSLGPVSVSQYLLKLFSFRMDFSGNPYGFTISGLRIRGQMLEFY